MRLVLPALLLAACPGGPPVDDDDATGGVDTLTRTDRPDRRSEVMAALDPAARTWLMFGGNEGPIVNQVARAAFRDDTWTFTVGEGWTEHDVAGPSARGRYGTGWDEAGGRALLFGGRYRDAEASGDYTLLRDLWAWDFDAARWTELDDGADGPRGRYYPATAWDDGRFWVWGGATNTSALNIQPSSDLWSWSPSEGWQEHPTTGDAPSSRAFFGSGYDPARHRLLVFGGQIGDFQSLAYHDFFALDLTTFSWTRLHDGSGVAPTTRMHAAVQVDGARDRYLVWGGHTDEGDANDLWGFDPAEGTWSVVWRGDVFGATGLGCLNNPSEVPADYVEPDLSGPERRHRGLHAVVDDNLWVFGGMHSECSNYLDDTWRYDLDLGAWHELIEARSGESCARRGESCACLCL